MALGLELPIWLQWLQSLSGATGIFAVILTVTVILRDRKARKREQAAQISAWADEVKPVRTSREDGTPLQFPPSTRSVRVKARNASDAPAYDFQVWVHHTYAPDSAIMGSPDRHILPPGEYAIWVDGVHLPKGGLAEMPYVDLSFKDEYGRRWQRTYDGGLKRDRLSRHGRRSRLESK